MMYDGYYYVLYDKCSDELQNEFVQKNNGEPVLYKDGICQYDNEHRLIK